MPPETGTGAGEVVTLLDVGVKIKFYYHRRVTLKWAAV